MLLPSWDTDLSSLTCGKVPFKFKLMPIDTSRPTKDPKTFSDFSPPSTPFPATKTSSPHYSAGAQPPFGDNRRQAAPEVVVPPVSGGSVMRGAIRSRPARHPWSRSPQWQGHCNFTQTQTPDSNWSKQPVKKLDESTVKHMHKTHIWLSTPATLKSDKIQDRLINHPRNKVCQHFWEAFLLLHFFMCFPRCFVGPKAAVPLLHPVSITPTKSQRGWPRNNPEPKEQALFDPPK